MYQVSITHPLKNKNSNNTHIHSQAKSTTRQHSNIIINILYKSYKQKGKKITATSYI